LALREAALLDLPRRANAHLPILGARLVRQALVALDAARRAHLVRVRVRARARVRLRLRVRLRARVRVRVRVMVRVWVRVRVRVRVRVWVWVRVRVRARGAHQRPHVDLAVLAEELGDDPRADAAVGADNDHRARRQLARTRYLRTRVRQRGRQRQPRLAHVRDRLRELRRQDWLLAVEQRQHRCCAQH